MRRFLIVTQRYSDCVHFSVRGTGVKEREQGRVNETSASFPSCCPLCSPVPVCLSQLWSFLGHQCERLKLVQCLVMFILYFSLCTWKVRAREE